MLHTDCPIDGHHEQRAEKYISVNFYE